LRVVFAQKPLKLAEIFFGQKNRRTYFFFIPVCLIPSVAERQPPLKRWAAVAFVGAFILDRRTGCSRAEMAIFLTEWQKGHKANAVKINQK
jgi:hypothetical protein